MDAETDRAEIKATRADEVARRISETAPGASETGRGGSETGRGGSETGRGGSETGRGGSETAARVGEPSPRGVELHCRGWGQEGALRCLMNTLVPEVAEDSPQLVVYGGEGRAARSWGDYDRIVSALRRLRGEETLLMQSGRPVAVLPSHADAPRALISTAMLVPESSGEAEFTRLQEDTHQIPLEQPKPIRIFQCQCDQGSRSRRAGMSVSIVPRV